MTDENTSYHVEVGVTQTGVIKVVAQSEDEAREEAKKQAKENPEHLHFSQSFTNNVRSMEADSDS